MKLYTSKQLASTFNKLPLTINEQLTFKALAGFINAKTLTCYPSYKAIAKKTGFSLRTTISHVKEIIKIGLFTKSKNFYICKKTKQARQSTNTYRLIRSKLLSYVQSFFSKCSLHSNSAPHSFKTNKTKTNKGFSPFNRTKNAQSGHFQGNMTQENFAASPNAASYLEKIRKMFSKS